MAWKTVYEKNNRPDFVIYPKFVDIKVYYEDEMSVALLVATNYNGGLLGGSRVWNTLAQVVDDYSEAIDWGIEIIDQWFTKWELEQEASKNAE